MKYDEIRRNTTKYELKYDESYLCVNIVCTPSLSKAFLPSDVPHDEMYIFPNNFFHVTAKGWWRVDDFIH